MYPRHVGHDVQATVGGDGAIDQVLHRGLVGNIDDVSLTANAWIGFSNFGRVLGHRVKDVCENDVHALGGQRFADSAT